VISASPPPVPLSSLAFSSHQPSHAAVRPVCSSPPRHQSASSSSPYQLSPRELSPLSLSLMSSSLVSPTVTVSASDMHGHHTPSPAGAATLSLSHTLFISVITAVRPMFLIFSHQKLRWYSDWVTLTGLLATGGHEHFPIFDQYFAISWKWCDICTVTNITVTCGVVYTPFSIWAKWSRVVSSLISLSIRPAYVRPVSCWSAFIVIQYNKMVAIAGRWYTMLTTVSILQVLLNMLLAN